jgi:hypothetical protein
VKQFEHVSLKRGMSRAAISGLFKENMRLPSSMSFAANNPLPAVEDFWMYAYVFEDMPNKIEVCTKCSFDGGVSE